MLYRGTIERGQRRGTALGFPTANTALHDKTLSGIYTAKAVLRGMEYEAAVFVDTQRGIMETHLLDFPAEDLYGEVLVVEPFEKLREHESFNSDELLRARIAEDIQAVRTYFKVHG